MKDKISSIQHFSYVKSSFVSFRVSSYENKKTVSSPTSNVDCWRNYVQNNIPQHNKFIFLGIKSYGNNLGVFLFQNRVIHQSNALLITSLLHVQMDGWKGFFLGPTNHSCLMSPHKSAKTCSRSHNLVPFYLKSFISK